MSTFTSHDYFAHIVDSPSTASLLRGAEATPLRPAMTRVVCTLGPSSRSVAILEQLLDAGMSTARFNFSHGDHAYHQETLDNLRIASRNRKAHVAVMLDTKGPEIRTGKLKDDKARAAPPRSEKACLILSAQPVTFLAGAEITIGDATRLGDESSLACSYEKLSEHVSPGSAILVADGSLSLTVISCDVVKREVLARVNNTATIGEHKARCCECDERRIAVLKASIRHRT
jgi:pyruvate kinase